MPTHQAATWKPACPGKSLEPIMKPGKANISRNVASFPHQLTSKRSMWKTSVAITIIPPTKTSRATRPSRTRPAPPVDDDRDRSRR